MDFFLKKISGWEDVCSGLKSSLLTQRRNSVKIFFLQKTIDPSFHKNMCAPWSQRKLKISHIIKGTSPPALSAQFCTMNNFVEQLRQKKCFLVEQIYSKRNHESKTFVELIIANEGLLRILRIQFSGSWITFSNYCKIYQIVAVSELQIKLASIRSVTNSCTKYRNV